MTTSMSVAAAAVIVLLAITGPAIAQSSSSSTTSSTSTTRSTSSTQSTSSSSSVEDFASVIGAGLPAYCGPLVQNLVNTDLVTCFTQGTIFTEVDSASTGAENFVYASLCEDSCLDTLFGFIITLNTFGCLPDSEAFSFDQILSVRAYFSLLCANGGGTYCGELIPLIGSFNETGTISQMQCQAIADAGQCLGTIVNFFESQFTDVPDDITSILEPEDVQVILGELETACSNASVSLSSAADGTEPLASISSASSVTALFSVFVAGFAAFLAMN